ncbi:MAG: PorV/PorQ family protein [Spirochaetia bacterium]|nr:PorV/PorQ family protein [Spirochaetia bacterium]
MKRRAVFTVFVIFFLITAASVFAAGAGVTSNNPMKLAQGARPSGMGEAFVGLADDANAAFWNPAGLAQLTRNQVCLMHSAWLIDVNFEYVTYALPIKGIGTFALYGLYLNGGEIYRTDEDSLGQYLLTDEVASANFFDITLAYAKTLGDFLGPDSRFSDLSVGLNLNIMSETIHTDSGGGFGANIGLFYYPKYENYSVGFVAENLGFATNRPELPATVKLGFGYRFAMENMMAAFTDERFFTVTDNNTAGSLDIIYEINEQTARVHVGAEKYWDLNKLHSIAVRLGYKFGEDLGVLAGMTAGLGYRLTTNKDTNFELDYVLVPYAELGMSHRISLTGKFLGTAENHFNEDRAGGLEFYRRGYDELYKKEFSNALYDFSQCIKRYRKYAPAYIGIGACFLNLGKKDIALKAYAKAMELDPSNEKLKAWLEENKLKPAVPATAQ